MNQSVKQISEDLTSYLRQLILQAEANNKDSFCKLCSLFLFLCKIAKSEDKRIAQKIFDIHKKQTLDLTLTGYQSCWNFIQFWELSAQDLSPGLTSVYRKSIQSAENNLLAWFNNRLTVIQNTFKSWKGQSSTNIIIVKNMIINFECSELTESTVIESLDFILTILDSCSDMTQLIQSTLYLFSENGQALTSSIILAIGQILCDVNSIVRLFTDNKATMVEMIEQALFKNQEYLIQLLESKKKLVTTDKKYTENKLDTLSFLMLASSAVVGPMNVTRANMTKLCIDLIASTGSNIFRDSDIKAVEQVFEKIQKLCTFWHILEDAQIIPELFLQTELLAILLDDAYRTKTSSSIIPLCEVWSSTSYKIIAVAKEGSVEEQTQLLENIVQDNVITPLCTELENQLRLVVFDRAGSVPIANKVFRSRV